MVLRESPVFATALQYILHFFMIRMINWLPQASYFGDNISEISNFQCILTENQNEKNFYLLILHELSVFIELKIFALLFDNLRIISMLFL